MRYALLTILVLATCVSGIVWAAEPPVPLEEEKPTNLVLNPGFEDPDPKDPLKAEHWDFRKHTAEWAARTDEDAHTGKYSLKVSAAEEKPNFATEIAQVVKLEPGKTYRVTCWAKYKEHKSGGMAITAWYQFAKRNPNYSNYKSQANLSPRKKGWHRVTTTYINIYDKSTKKNSPLKALVPGTVAARICPAAYYGKLTVYVDDIEFTEIPAAPEEK